MRSVGAVLIQDFEVFAHRTRRPLPARQGIRLGARHASDLVHIRPDQTGIDRERIATHQIRRKARFDNRLEYPTQDIGFAEAVVTGAGEGRMVGDHIFKAKTAEPAIGHIDLHLRAELALGANGEDIAHDKHADHQLRINGGPPRMAIIRRQLAAQPSQVQNRIDAPH